jgi:hypothetical protein
VKLQNFYILKIITIPASNHADYYRGKGDYAGENVFIQTAPTELELGTSL